MFKIFFLLLTIFINLSQVSADKKNIQNKDQNQQTTDASQNIQNDETSQQTNSAHKAHSENDDKQNDLPKSIQSRLIIVPRH